MTVFWNMGETSFIVLSGVKVKVGNNPCSFVLFSAMFKKFVWLKRKKLTCYKIYFSQNSLVSPLPIILNNVPDSQGPCQHIDAW